MNSWKSIRDKALKATFAPGERVWEKIENRLDEQDHTHSIRRRSALRLGWMAAAVTGIITFYLFLTPSPESAYHLETLTSDQHPIHQKAPDLRSFPDTDLRFHKKGRLIPNYQQISKSPLIINRDS